MVSMGNDFFKYNAIFVPRNGSSTANIVLPYPSWNPSLSTSYPNRNLTRTRTLTLTLPNPKPKPTPEADHPLLSLVPLLLTLRVAIRTNENGFLVCLPCELRLRPEYARQLPRWHVLVQPLWLVTRSILWRHGGTFSTLAFTLTIPLTFTLTLIKFQPC